MIALLILLKLNGMDERARAGEDAELAGTIIGICLLPVILTLGAPWLVWYAARGLGAERLTAWLAVLVALAMPAGFALLEAFWMVGLVLFSTGLASLAAIWATGVRDRRRQR